MSTVRTAKLNGLEPGVSKTVMNILEKRLARLIESRLERAVDRASRQIDLRETTGYLLGPIA
jgi:hypothetical protein